MSIKQIPICRIIKFALSCENECANFALFIAEKSVKISASGQTYGQRLKMGLFNPRSMGEEAHYDYHENKRFSEEIKEKS